jgi:hypothetical protein
MVSNQKLALQVPKVHGDKLPFAFVFLFLKKIGFVLENQKKERSIFEREKFFLNNFFFQQLMDIQIQ